jgi:hypothetical protein
MTEFDRSALLTVLDSAGIEYEHLTSLRGWAIVVPSLGAKVLGVGVDGENAFWVATPPVPGTWLTGGQRTWIAPEMGPESLYFRDGGWLPPPSMDPGHYQPIANGAEDSEPDDRSAESGHSRIYSCPLSLTTASGTRYTLELQRSIRILETPLTKTNWPASHLRIGQRLINRDRTDTVRGLGLWSILQLPNAAEGTAIIVTGNRPNFRTTGYFGTLPTEWTRRLGSNLVIWPRQGTRFKFGVAAKDSGTCLCGIRPAIESGYWMVILKRFAVDAGGLYVDKPDSSPRTTNGDAVQVYNSPEIGTAGFSEIECHSPSRPIEPGESLSHEVSISVLKVPDGAVAEVLCQEISPDLDGLSNLLRP